MEVNLDEIKKTYNTYLQKLIDGCNQISTSIRNDNVPEALQLINQFVEGVVWMDNINIKMNQLNEVNEFNLKQIEEYLTHVNSGLELGDFILVSDIFEYEIKTFFETCNPYDISKEN